MPTPIALQQVYDTAGYHWRMYRDLYEMTGEQSDKNEMDDAHAEWNSLFAREWAARAA